jgi:hypothetical protein
MMPCHAAKKYRQRPDGAKAGTPPCVARRHRRGPVLAAGAAARKATRQIGRFPRVARVREVRRACAPATGRRHRYKRYRYKLHRYKRHAPAGVPRE